MTTPISRALALPFKEIMTPIRRSDSPQSQLQTACTADAKADAKPAETGETWGENHSGVYKHAAAWLINVLNMAGPDSNAPGTWLTRPNLSLSLTVPKGNGQSSEAVRHYPVEKVAITAEERAAEIIDQLGDGTELSISNAITALAIPNPGKTQNKAALIEKYFDRVDTDNSGTLTQSELTRLISYYDERNAETDGRILLPKNWA